MKRRNLNIFQSNNDKYSLPSSSPSSLSSSPYNNNYNYNNSSSFNFKDGSGKGIQMDAPIVRSWKKASGYTKGSYIWSIVSLLVMIWSYRFMMYRYATTFLSCDKSNMCKLLIIPPRRQKQLKMKIHRDQLVSTKQLQVTSNGDLLSSIDGRNNGEIFDSYGLIVHQYGKEYVEILQMEKDVQEKMKQYYDEKDEEIHNRHNNNNKNKKKYQNDSNNNLMKDTMKDTIQKSLEQQEEVVATPKDSLEDNNSGKTVTKINPQVLSEQIAKRNMAAKQQDNNNNDNNAGDHRYMEFLKQQENEIRVKKQRLLDMKESKRNKDEKAYPRLDELYYWSEPTENKGEYMIIMRKYNVEDRKRRVTSLMRSIENYIERRREAVIIRENRNVAWQGILGLIFGVFSFLLSLLVGQFWEPTKSNSRSRQRNTHLNAVRRKNINNLNTQAPTVVPRHFSSSSSRQQAPMRQKAYGGYVPGKSTY